MAGPEVQQRNVSYNNNLEGTGAIRRTALNSCGSSSGGTTTIYKDRRGKNYRHNSNPDNNDDNNEGSSMISAGNFDSKSTCRAGICSSIDSSSRRSDGSNIRIGINNFNNSNNNSKNKNINNALVTSNSYHQIEILVDSTRLRSSSTADDIEQGAALDNDDGTGGAGSGTEDGDTLTKKHVRHKNRPLIRRIITYIRNAIYGVRFASSIDSELEELDNLPPRYRPDSLSALCRATKFSEAEIKRIYRGFKAECPTGVVREDTFKIIYASFFPQGANSGSYAHYVFNTLDQDHSGLVSFEEFVQGLSVLSRGTIDEKLRWTFSLYDINGDGYITKEEMTDIVTAIFELVGSKDTMEGESERIKVKVDRLFEKMDVNRDGVVTLEEFLDCCHKDEAISKSITVFDTTF